MFEVQFFVFGLLRFAKIAKLAKIGTSKVFNLIIFVCFLTQVFYVDYGNTAVVTDKNIRKLLRDFLHLPLQAVECFLNETDVTPGIQDESEVYEIMR